MGSRNFKGFKAIRSTVSLLAITALIGIGMAESLASESKRSKVIDFDDEVVEGINKKPLDSLSQISDRDRKRKKTHLYKKRSGFRTEVAETLRFLPYTQ